MVARALHSKTATRTVSFRVRGRSRVRWGFTRAPRTLFFSRPSLPRVGESRRFFRAAIMAPEKDPHP